MTIGDIVAPQFLMLSIKPLSQKALRQLVSDLASTLERVEQELSQLWTYNQAPQEEVGQLRLDNGNLHASNQALKDEITRLKNLPQRPPFKPSGMASVHYWDTEIR